MTDTPLKYDDLNVEDSWIENLRIRLPYSFNRVREDKQRGQPRQFVLSEPVLLTGMLAAERHNFWRRGNVYYMSGKLLDFYSMSQIGQHYRHLEVIRLLTSTGGAQYIWPTDPFAFYNSMQMEKVWGFAQHNHLDRERVMMTNLALAVELCLKASLAHASYLQNQVFKFSAGHNIAKLYEGLPEPLRDEIVVESRAFANDYVEFRRQLDVDLARIRAFDSSLPRTPSITQQRSEADWEMMAQRIREGDYTAFVNSNDPSPQLGEGWFEDALDQTNQAEGFSDLIEYLRYAPLRDKDDLPVPLINGVLLLGRFMYEHLFPVPTAGNGPLTGFPTKPTGSAANP